MITTILIFLSIASFVTNFILGWYCRKIIMILSLANQTSDDFFARLNSYIQHLESVYQLQVFHGDKTIRALIMHSKEISEYLKIYSEITSFTRPDLKNTLEELEKKEEIKRELDGYNKEN